MLFRSELKSKAILLNVSDSSIHRHVLRRPCHAMRGVCGNTGDEASFKWRQFQKKRRDAKTQSVFLHVSAPARGGLNIPVQTGQARRLFPTRAVHYRSHNPVQIGQARRPSRQYSSPRSKSHNPVQTGQARRHQGRNGAIQKRKAIYDHTLPYRIKCVGVRRHPPRT